MKNNIVMQLSWVGGHVTRAGYATDHQSQVVRRSITIRRACYSLKHLRANTAPAARAALVIHKVSWPANRARRANRERRPRSGALCAGALRMRTHETRYARTVPEFTVGWRLVLAVLRRDASRHHSASQQPASTPASNEPESESPTTSCARTRLATSRLPVAVRD